MPFPVIPVKRHVSVSCMRQAVAVVVQTPPTQIQPGIGAVQVAADTAVHLVITVPVVPGSVESVMMVARA